MKMSLYFNKIPFFLRWIYPKAIWHIKTKEKVLYLTFDDGPTKSVTDWVLDTLDAYNAKATFFCVGENVNTYPELYLKLKKKGHSIGNHSYNHLKGTKTNTSIYLKNISEANNIINSKLLRPPYGSMKINQYKILIKNYKIIMWSVLAGDFDKKIDGNKCANIVIKNSKKGSIIVFHDSKKAYPKLKIALPKVLEHYSKLGYKFESIKM